LNLLGFAEIIIFSLSSSSYNSCLDYGFKESCFI